MQIIGNTYVGGNPAQQQLSQSMDNAANRVASSFALKRQQQATANENIRAEEERRAKEAFLTLDAELKAYQQQNGSIVFEDDSHAGFKQAQQLLLGASSAYARAYGGNASDYASAFTKRPMTLQQLKDWDLTQKPPVGNNQPVGRGASPGDNVYLDKGFTRQASYTGSAKAAEPAAKITPVVPKPAPVTPPVVKVDPPLEAPPDTFQTSPINPELAKNFINKGIPGSRYGGSGTFTVIDPVTGKFLDNGMGKPFQFSDYTQALKALSFQAGQYLKNGRLPAPQMKMLEALVTPHMTAADQAGNRTAELRAVEGQRLANTQGAQPVPAGAIPTFRQWLIANPQYVGGPFTQDPDMPDSPKLLEGNPIALDIYRKAMGIPNQARGTGQPQMSPAELARHEATTGDVHYPALIGVKEGVVNARAMENGGDEVVRMLNAGYPAYIGGKGMGIEEEPSTSVIPPDFTGYAPQGEVTDVPVNRPNQPTGYSATNNGPETPATMGTRVPVGEETQARSYQPAGEKSDLVRMIDSMVTDSAKVIRSKAKAAKATYDVHAPRIAALVGQKYEAISLGNMPKAKAVTTRLLDEERKAIISQLADPAYREHNAKVREGLRKFMETADDTQLAYYGFNDVLKAKQDKKRFEEEIAINKDTRLAQQATRDFQNASSLNAKENTALVGKQIELYAAQIQKTNAEEALVTARANAIKNDPKSFAMQNTMEEIRKWSDTYKTPDELNEFIQQNPAIRTAFDNYAKAITDDPTATWAAASKKGFFASIWASIFGGSQYVTPKPSAATTGGGGGAQGLTDPGKTFIKNNGLQ